MRYRDNDECFGVSPVDDQVREAVHTYAPEVTLEIRAGIGKFSN